MKTTQDLLFAVLKRWWRLTVPVRMRRHGCNLGSDVIFYGMPIVSSLDPLDVSIGDRAILVSHSRFTALGVSRPCILRTTRTGAQIQIGSDTGMSGCTICSAISVIIGKQCLIGADVLIADNDFHPIKPEGRRFNNAVEDIGAAPITIGDNVFIGARSIILKGVRIGKNSVIGAGSVVSSDIPADAIAVGNPARVIRTIA